MKCTRCDGIVYDAETTDPQVNNDQVTPCDRCDGTGIEPDDEKIAAN